MVSACDPLTLSLGPWAVGASAGDLGHGTHSLDSLGMLSMIGGQKVEKKLEGGKLRVQSGRFN